MLTAIDDHPCNYGVRQSCLYTLHLFLACARSAAPEFLLAPSGALVFIMGYYIHIGHFFIFFKFGAILPIYIHNSLSLSFSVEYTEQSQATLLHELH